MPNQVGSIQFGFPEFWCTAAEAYPVFFARVGRLESALNSVIDRAYPSPGLNKRQLLMLNLLMLVAYGFNENITLVGNGMTHGAMKVVRGMVENAINAEYIRIFPEQSDVYFEWHWVDSYQLLQMMQKHKPALLQRVPADLQDGIRTEYFRVKHLFETKNTKGKVRVRDSWCADNLARRAEKTGFTQIYFTVMPESNQILHGSVGGLLSHMGSQEGSKRLEALPNLKYASKALIAGHAATLQTLESVSKTLYAIPEPDVQSLTADFHLIWNVAPKEAV